MEQNKDEILKELESVNKVLGHLHARRRILREQAAHHGNMVPPHILTEIEDITIQIARTQEEAKHLEIQAVEERLSLNESEYLLELTRVWNTSEGYPNTEGFALLELKRLLLTIPTIRATELEGEIREALAEERLAAIQDISVFDMISRRNDVDIYYQDLAAVVKPLIFLHRKTALKLFEIYKCNWQKREFDLFFKLLIQNSNRVTQMIQGPILKSFVDVLEMNLMKRHDYDPDLADTL